MCLSRQTIKTTEREGNSRPGIPKSSTSSLTKWMGFNGATNFIAKLTTTALYGNRKGRINSFIIERVLVTG